MDAPTALHQAFAASIGRINCGVAKDAISSLGAKCLQAPTFAMAAGLAVITAAVGPLQRNAFTEVTAFFRNIIDPFSYMHIPQSDSAYSCVEMWLAHVLKEPRYQSSLTVKKRDVVASTRIEPQLVGGSPAKMYMEYTLAEGSVTYVRFEGYTVSVIANTTKADYSVKRGGGEKSAYTPPTRQITLRIMSRTVQPLVNLIEAARAYGTEHDKSFVKVYNVPNAWSTGWSVVEKIPKYDMDNSKHDPKLLAGIIKDIEHFLKRKDVYLSRSMRWKRGYLLYGPPGNGKSTFIHLIASYLGRDIAVMKGSPGGRASSLTCIPDNCILVFEDVDCAMKGRDSKDFAELLGMLDGAGGSSECGAITFMTTNYVGKLDPALVRPGRMDARYLIANPASSRTRPCTPDSSAVRRRTGLASISMSASSTIRASPADIIKGAEEFARACLDCPTISSCRARTSNPCYTVRWTSMVSSTRWRNACARSPR
jgi:hypothetical protein